ncbi:MAG: ADP-ribose pyrophosphatase [Pseudonocardiales bacterium]|nr:ADP-ribose pyrophosphatase [Pseudonocardiales bacterium]
MSFTVVPASYVYLLTDRRVLLQQRRNTGYMDGLWVAGAAGHIETQETAAACAIREAAEELGITIRVEDLQPLTVMQRTDGTDSAIDQRVDWFFAARSWHGTPTVMEPAKCAGIAWFDLDDLPTPIPSYEREVLNGIATGCLPMLTHHGFGPPA